MQYHQFIFCRITIIMDSLMKNYFQQNQRTPKIYDCIFEFDYFLNLKLKVSCGFSTVLAFKPMIWFHYKNKHFIGFDREEWLYLMSYKEFISNILSQRKFKDSINLINNTRESNTKYFFRFKKNIYNLVIQQGIHKIKINLNTWNSLIRIGIFLTSILCWNGVLRKQLLHFYYQYYIPSCAMLNKTQIQLGDIMGINERDVEIDLTRLCFEIGLKMQSKIKTDVKVHRLCFRMANK